MECRDNSILLVQVNLGLQDLVGGLGLHHSDKDFETFGNIGILLHFLHTAKGKNPQSTLVDLLGCKDLVIVHEQQAAQLQQAIPAQEMNPIVVTSCKFQVG